MNTLCPNGHFPGFLPDDMAGYLRICSSRLPHHANWFRDKDPCSRPGSLEDLLLHSSESGSPGKLRLGLPGFRLGSLQQRPWQLCLDRAGILRASMIYALHWRIHSFPSSKKLPLILEEPGSWPRMFKLRQNFPSLGNFENAIFYSEPTQCMSKCQKFLRNRNSALAQRVLPYLL